MTPSFFIKLFTVVFVVLGVVLTIDTWTSVEAVQRGFSGVGMEVVYKDHMLQEDADQVDGVPPPLPMASSEGLKAGEAYQNVQVLGHLSTGQFTRLMTHITQWVSPEQGCNYCHYAENLASDGKYTKVVSRRMIQMTQHLNENWSSHLQNAGVNCYTCHRGMNVPQYIWFEEPEHPMKDRALGNPGGQNMASYRVGSASLPSNVFETFLQEDYNIRVVGPTALPTGNNRSIKQTEWTYGLMMHMSNSLGVNCTYCHNSRSVAEWGQSPPARATAWYGIRMVRDVNNNYLDPLKPVYPEYRLGPTGDAPKANCTTCHQGVYKPLLGMNMVEDYPSLKKYVPYEPSEEAEEAEEAADEADEADSEEEGADEEADAESEEDEADDEEVETSRADGGEADAAQAATAEAAASGERAPKPSPEAEEAEAEEGQAAAASKATGDADASETATEAESKATAGVESTESATEAKAEGAETTESATEAQADGEAAAEEAAAAPAKKPAEETATQAASPDTETETGTEASDG
jgi:photosynthetic reaction center cytochrome c subunit